MPGEAEDGCTRRGSAAQVGKLVGQGDVVAEIVLAIPALGQQAEVGQDSLVADELGGQVGADIDLAHGQEPACFADDSLQESSFHIARLFGEFERLFVQDEFALLGQRQYDLADDGGHIVEIGVFRGHIESHDFLGEPATLLGVDFFVGAKQIERRAGVVDLTGEEHLDLAAVMEDQFRDQGGGSHVEAAILRDGDLNAADLGVALEHVLAEADGTADILVDEGDAVIHQHVEQGIGFDETLHLRPGRTGLLVDVPFVIVGKQRARFEQVEHDAGVPAQHGQGPVLALDLGAGDVRVVLRLQVVEAELQAAEPFLRQRSG